MEVIDYSNKKESRFFLFFSLLNNKTQRERAREERRKVRRERRT